MKTICLHFEIHQNVHLKRYRFFDIGSDHYYYDDYEDEKAITETAEKSYIPALSALIEMAEENPKFFKCSISLSGVTIELLDLYAPQVIDLIKKLVNTGCCEIVAQPYSHGLASLANEACFREETKQLCEKIKVMFNVKPTIFINSCAIYSDEIGRIVQDLGFQGMLTEGARHILGWKSPHFVYNAALAPKLKLLLRDNHLSEDICYRFSNSNWSGYPLFADKYMDWIAQMPEDEEVINLFMELCALGIFQPLSSNILEFLKSLPSEAQKRNITFSTPSEVCKNYKSVGPLQIADPISWTDEERNLSPWLGNIMQQEAYNKLYSIAERINVCNDRRLKQDWNYLQATNNFGFISTKIGSENDYRGIYENAYDAFTNYMNIIGDFTSRVNNLYPDMDIEELSPLMSIIKNQEAALKRKDRELDKLLKTIDLLKSKKEPTQEKTPKEHKPAVKKTK